MATPSPLDIETRYQRLLEVMEGPVSERWAVVQADTFLDRLGLTSTRAESYLLSLAEPLAECASQLDPIGLHPDRLSRLAGNLREAHMARAALGDCEALFQAERHLRRRAALLYGYAGAIERAAECLSEPDSSSHVAAIDEKEASPREGLHEALARAEGTPLEPGLRWVERHWERREEQGTRVPVVERLPSWARGGDRDVSAVGALQRIAVEIYGPAESSDRIRAGGAAHGAEASSLTEEPVTAARRLLTERFSSLEGRFVEGRVTFGQAKPEYEGRSGDLAIAALLYSAILEHERCRTRVQVRPEVLLTGRVSPDGTVQSVGEEGLPVKVQTAFFSPKTCLVLPDPQHEVARSIRDRLLETFPWGQLHLVGVGRLDEVFYDRRLTRRKRISRPQRAAQWVWDRRWTVGLGTVVLGLLAAIGMLLYGPINQNPASTRASGSTLFIDNENGRTVERMEVGRALVRKVKRGEVKRLTAFADVTGEETREIFWAGPLSENARADAIRAKAVGADTLLWKRPLRFEVNFPDKPEVTESSFGIADLRAEDLNRDGTSELYVLVHHRPYFPSLLLRLNPDDGRVKQRYVHPGHLRSGIAVADLTGGPAPEILVGGHSNAFGDPVLAVLPSSDLSGHAPTQGDYAVGNTERADHVAYLRFPSTPVQKRRPATYPMIWQIRAAPTAKTLEVVAQDGRMAQAGTSRPKVISTLDYNLAPRSVGTDGTYDRLADSLVQQGVLETAPNPEAFRRYGKNIRYWTGTGWSTEPTFTQASSSQ